MDAALSQFPVAVIWQLCKWGFQWEFLKGQLSYFTHWKCDQWLLPIFCNEMTPLINSFITQFTLHDYHGKNIVFEKNCPTQFETLWTITSHSQHCLPHAHPQRPRSFRSGPRIVTSGKVPHWKSVIHRLAMTLRMLKWFDWLKIQNKFSAHAQKIGPSQRSHFVELTN